MSINERDYMQKCDGCGTLLSPDGICSNCGANGIFDTEKQSEKICEEVVRQWLLTICHDLCINVPSIILTKRSIESQYGRAAGQSTGGEITLRIDPEYDKNIYLFILCHELRHEWLFANGIAQTERECNDYAKEVIARLQFPNCERYTDRIWTDNNPKPRPVTNDAYGCLVPCLLFIGFVVWWFCWPLLDKRKNDNVPNQQPIVNIGDYFITPDNTIYRKETDHFCKKMFSGLNGENLVEVDNILSSEQQIVKLLEYEQIRFADLELNEKFYFHDSDDYAKGIWREKTNIGIWKYASGGIPGEWNISSATQVYRIKSEEKSKKSIQHGSPIVSIVTPIQENKQNKIVSEENKLTFGKLYIGAHFIPVDQKSDIWWVKATNTTAWSTKNGETAPFKENTEVKRPTN